MRFFVLTVTIVRVYNNLYEYYWICSQIFLHQKKGGFLLRFHSFGLIYLFLLSYLCIILLLLFIKARINLFVRVTVFQLMHILIGIKHCIIKIFNSLDFCGYYQLKKRHSGLSICKCRFIERWAYWKWDWKSIFVSDTDGFNRARCLGKLRLIIFSDSIVLSYYYWGFFFTHFFMKH